MDLAASWVKDEHGNGVFETVAFVEIEPFCQAVLRKNFGSDIVIFDDVRTLTAESLRERNVGHVDVVCGGFPCQPFSLAGKRKGTTDDRNLWPQMLRVIKETRPAWVVGENVPGLIRMALDAVLSDLEGEGYTCQAIGIPACGVGAPHIRERVWIVGHSERVGGERRRELGELAGTAREGQGDEEERQRLRLAIDAASQVVAHADGGDGHRWGGNVQVGRGGSEGEAAPNHHTGRTQWSVEPGMGRVAYGVSRRVDRLRALGNAVVPQVCYPIFEAIAAMERP